MKNLNKSMKNKNDERYTPPILVNPIVEFLKPDSTIWCPFDTESSEFVKILTQNGFKVIYTHIENGFDFLEYEPQEHYDYIVSNPPFSIKLKVMEKLYNLNKPWAMLMNIEILNYQEVGTFFFNRDSDIQLLIFDKKVSFDGNTSSFNTSYFCKDILPKDIIFYHLPHNNTKNNFIGSGMKLNNKEI